MKKILKIKAKIRKKTKNAAKILKKQNKIPAVLYGKKTKSKVLQVAKKEFEKIYQKAGTTTLIDLVVEDEKEPKKVLIHQIEYNPITLEVSHIDFYQIDMTKKIKTEVPIQTLGKSLAVEELDGSLILPKPTIEIECLPQDLIHEIKVDISKLKTFEDKIIISDLDIPKNVDVLDKKSETIATVAPPRTEEELKELEETPVEETKEVEVLTEKKDEEEKEEGVEQETPEKIKTEQKTEQESEKIPDQK